MTFSGSKRNGWSGASLCAGFALVIGCASHGDEAGDVATEADSYRGPQGTQRSHGAGKGASHGKGGVGKGQGKGHGAGNGHGKGHGKGHGHQHGDDCEHPSTGGTGTGVGSGGTGGGFASGGSASSGKAGSGSGGGGGTGPWGSAGSGGGGYEVVCGDGIQDWPEQCDDGNTASDDGCSSECVLDEGYYCDYYGGCALSVCGDGIVRESGDGNGGWIYEECDDGNEAGGDGCSSECRLEEGYSCSYFGVCTHHACGDGSVQGYSDGNGGWIYEACDDGNEADGDGCSSVCAIEPGYACDWQGDACHPVVCGDGFQEGYYLPGSGEGTGGSSPVGTGGSGPVGSAGYGGGGGYYVYVYEQCDDANTASGDGCSEACEIEPNYVCDLPGTPCRVPVCGDGFRDWVTGTPPEGYGGAGGGGAVIIGGSAGTMGGGEPMYYERCDDGNTTSGDGCDDECLVEPGYNCDIYQQPCMLPVCGDGIYDWQNEGCDDGNTTSGDGCSSACEYEYLGTGGTGWSPGGMGGAGGSWGRAGTGATNGGWGGGT